MPDNNFYQKDETSVENPLSFCLKTLPNVTMRDPKATIHLTILFKSNMNNLLLCLMMRREGSLETLPNVTMRNPKSLLHLTTLFKSNMNNLLLCLMMIREGSLETLPSVNIRDPKSLCILQYCLKVI